MSISPSSRGWLLLTAAVSMLCVYSVSALPTPDQLQVRAQKRIFCNFIGCGNKRSSPANTMMDSYKLLQRFQNEELPNELSKQNDGDDEDELDSTDAMDGSNRIKTYGFNSPLSQRNSMADYDSMRSLRRQIQEANMWEVLLEKLRRAKAEQGQ